MHTLTRPYPPHVPKYPVRHPAQRPLRTFTAVASALMALALTLAALYLVKSALGINLLPGPSPLHASLYHLVR